LGNLSSAVSAVPLFFSRINTKIIYIPLGNIYLAYYWVDKDISLKPSFGF